MVKQSRPPFPPRACSTDLEKFAHMRSKLVVRQAGAPLCGEARFRESQDAVREFVVCYGAVIGKDLQFTPVLLPEDARWGDDGLIGEWCAVGGHYETLWWKLDGNLRKLDPAVPVVLAYVVRGFGVVIRRRRVLLVARIRIPLRDRLVHVHRVGRAGSLILAAAGRARGARRGGRLGTGPLRLGQGERAGK